MHLVIPSLFKLIGRGFKADAYAADGNHLRWMFDPRLGFPRVAFCLERRPALGSDRGNAGAHTTLEAFNAARASAVASVVRGAVSAVRFVGSLALSANGIALSTAPLVLDFHGGSAPPADPQACWVRLTLVVFLGGSSGRAEALYSNRGDFEAVDAANFSYGRRGPIFGLPTETVGASQRVMALLDAPTLGPNPPRLLDPSAQQLYRTLVASSSTRYARVTPAYLQSVLAGLKAGGFDVADVVPSVGIRHTITVDLRGDHIDRVTVVGKNATLLSVQWCTVEDLMNGRGWEPVDCYPAATDSKDYFDRNRDLLSSLDVKSLAIKRATEPLPHGAEPLDDPQVPPSRPPKHDELVARYVGPWIERLEPRLDAVLSQSLSGALHQSEVSLSGSLSHFGQKADDPLPALAFGQTMEVRPYGMLLLAASAFPAARIMGLAAVDVVDAGTSYDYRVRGAWRVEDLAAWSGKLHRDVADLQARILKATDAQKPALQASLIKKLTELVNFVPILTFLVGQAQKGFVTLYGLKLGVSPLATPLFDGPTSVAAKNVGLAVPPIDPDTNDSIGLTELDWPLRQRARALVSETIPMGAAFGRSEAPKGQPFELVLNARDPESGMPTMEIPEGPPGETGAAGTASFFDLHTPERHAWRYGVSEVDPFGRWSAFTTTDFEWSNDAPPPPPTHLAADLAMVGAPPAFELAVRFSWPTDRFAADKHTFLVNLRRTAPPSNAPGDPAQWGAFERQPGTGAGPLAVPGNFSGGLTHDGMPVVVSFVDRTEPDATYRDFTVVFHGPQFARDAIDRASAWVGVRSQNDRGILSASVNGPARADDILQIPPPVPSFPDPLLASYPDAQRRASFRIDWTGQADVRYLVYRAGEREIVQLLHDRGLDTSAYDPGAPANLRAAALRSFAVLAADAFDPRSGLLPDPPRDASGRETDPKTWPSLPGGGRFFVDELPGGLRTLSVYVVLGKSKSGIRSAWPSDPSAFAVVAVPQIPEAERPRVQGAWEPPTDPDAARVELLIAEPREGTAPVGEYEVYRTQDPSKTGDYRLMRRIHGLANPAFEDDPSSDFGRVARFVDPTVAPYRTYFYRVVARALRPDGGGGTRSEPSGPTQVLTLSAAPPSAPTDVATVRTATELTVTFTVEAPSTSAGDFAFELRKGPASAPLTLARVTARSARAGTPDTYAVVLDPATILAGESLVVRVTDPLGRQTDSAPVVSA